MITLYGLDRLPTQRKITGVEQAHLDMLSNNVYDALERFSLAESRRDDLARLMLEVATKFFERGL